MTKTLMSASTDELWMIPIDSIHPAPDNVRDNVGDITDLAASILANGLQQPLRVVMLDKDNFQIIVGHRRHAALASLVATKKIADSVPCMVRMEALDDSTRVAAMLVENLQRTDLNPIEEAHAFHRLANECKMKPAEIATQIGRSTETVNARLRLLKLPDQVINVIRTGDLPLATADALTRVGDDAVVLKLTKQGAKVPTLADIEAAINELTAKRNFDAMTKTLTDAGVRISTDRPEPDMLSLFVSDSPAELKKEVGKFGKAAVAYITRRPWDGKCSVDVKRPMTETEKRKRDEQREAERAERDARWEADHARIQAERAANTAPEILAWEQECDRIRDAYHQARTEHDAKVTQAKVAWYASVTAKDAARWALQFVAGNANHRRMVRLFDIDVPDGSDTEDAYLEWIGQSASNLTAAAVAAFDDFDEYGMILPSEPVEKYEAFLDKHGLLDDPVLELPPRPEAAVEDDAA